MYAIEQRYTLTRSTATSTGCVYMCVGALNRCFYRYSTFYRIYIEMMYSLWNHIASHSIGVIKRI